MPAWKTPSKTLEGVFVTECCLFKFDLVVNAIHDEVARFGERNGVFRPYLAATLGNDFLEDFATIVRACFAFSVEIFDGAKNGAAASLQQFLLGFRRTEAERAAIAAACAIELANIGENLGGCVGNIDVATVGEAEQIFMGECLGVVCVNHIVKQCGVFHRLNSFLSWSVFIISRIDRPVNRKMENFQKYFFQFSIDNLTKVVYNGISGKGPFKKQMPASL